MRTRDEDRASRIEEAAWLSAAACFYLVPDLEQMRDAFARVKKLEQEGKIPADRRDIHAAIKERAAQIETLERQHTQPHTNGKVHSPSKEGAPTS